MPKDTNKHTGKNLENKQNMQKQTSSDDLVKKDIKKKILPSHREALNHIHAQKENNHE